MPDKRPNILFAFADDWGRYASAYRQIEGDNTPNALLDTPNFDRVAREGGPVHQCFRARAFLHTVPKFFAHGSLLLADGAWRNPPRRGLGFSHPLISLTAGRGGLPYRLYLQGVVAGGRHAMHPTAETGHATHRREQSSVSFRSS